MVNKEEHTLKVQQLFVRYQGQLKAYALTLWPDFSRAEDVMQEVFLTISAKSQEFEIDTSFLSWARAIVRFKLLELRRDTRDRSGSMAAFDSLIASCPEQWADDERLAALTSCLNELAPKAREILTLRYQREHSPQEIARLLSRSVNSINVALSKARSALRDCMDRQLKLDGLQ